MTVTKRKRYVSYFTINAYYYVMLYNLHSIPEGWKKNMFKLPSCLNGTIESPISFLFTFQCYASISYFFIPSFLTFSFLAHFFSYTTSFTASMSARLMQSCLFHIIILYFHSEFYKKKSILKKKSLTFWFLKNKRLNGLNCDEFITRRKEGFFFVKLSTMKNVWNVGAWNIFLFLLFIHPHPHTHEND